MGEQQGSSKRPDLPEVKTPLPGPRSREFIDRYLACFGGATPPRIAVAKAYGCIVEDMDGNRFLDLSQAASIAGHSVPEIVEASVEQLGRMVIRGTAAPALIEFTEALQRRLPGELRGGRVNHVASGTETVELAVALARAYTGRPLILSYHDSHHGFMGTPFELSGDPRIKRSWPARISDIVQVPYPTCYRCPFGRRHPECDLLCLRYLENVMETAALPDQVAALLMEPILVNGGMYVPPDDYVRGAADLCRRSGIQLIADEVYTGVGKSGRFLVVDHWSLSPDILCLSKALGAGFPLAAVVTRREVTDVARGGVRFTGTFAGNLVSCASGAASLRYIEEHRLVENAERVGGHLIEALRELSERKRSVGDVRGKGLLIGVELVEDKETKRPAVEYASETVNRALENGLLLSTRGRYGNVLTLTAPLALSMEQADAALEILDGLLE